MIRKLVLVGCLLGLAQSAWAVPALVRKCPAGGINGGNNTGTTVTCACASNAAGNLLFVWGIARVTTASLSVLDTAGNTYTNLTTNLQNGNATLRLFAAYNTILSVGTNTITITSNTSNSDNYCGAAEYSSLATASALDQTNNANNNATTAWTSGTVTTTNANEVMIGVAAGGNGSFTISAGTNVAWVLEGSTINGGLSPGWEDIIVSSTQTGVDAKFTYSGSTGGPCAIVTFLPASTPSGGFSKKKKIIFF